MSSGTLRDAFRAFTTGCALITTDGPEGPNVMAAEWTFNVSYDPFLILVSIDPANRTHDLIREAKEFGVNLVSEDQIAAMAFAGHYSKADTDKLSSELFEVLPGTRIKAPMIGGSLLRAECRLVQEIPMGDHTGFLGEVVDFSVDSERKPIVLHHGSRHLGERMARSPSISVAVAPMTATRGGSIAITGELTAPERAGAPISLEAIGPDEVPLPADALRSSEDGGFTASVELPPDLRPGTYVVVARSGAVGGRARFEVR